MHKIAERVLAFYVCWEWEPPVYSIICFSLCTTVHVTCCNLCLIMWIVNTSAPKVIVPQPKDHKCHWAPLTSLRLLTLWQQPVSLSSQWALLSSRCHIWVDCRSQCPPPPRAAGEWTNKSQRVPCSLLSSASEGAVLASGLVKAVTSGQIWTAPEERSRPLESNFKNVLTDRRARHRPRAGPGRAPLAARNWIHFSLSLSAVPSLPLSFRAGGDAR